MYSIETARLRLRPFRSTDLDALAPMQADPDVMRFIGNGQPRDRATSVQTIERYIAAWQHGFSMWAVETLDDATFVGRCGLWFLDNTPEVEVGYSFGKAWWGHGYATEAARASVRFGMETAQLPHIAGITYPENVASRRVLEKCDLRYQGMATFYGVHATYYTIVRSAWTPDDAPYNLAST